MWGVNVRRFCIKSSTAQSPYIVNDETVRKGVKQNVMCRDTVGYHSTEGGGYSVRTSCGWGRGCLLRRTCRPHDHGQRIETVLIPPPLPPKKPVKTSRSHFTQPAGLTTTSLRGQSSLGQWRIRALVQKESIECQQNVKTSDWHYKTSDYTAKWQGTGSSMMAAPWWKTNYNRCVVQWVRNFLNILVTLKEITERDEDVCFCAMSDQRFRAYSFF